MSESPHLSPLKAPELTVVHRLASDLAGIPAVVDRWASEHAAWNAAALNLVASHNYMSPAAQALLSSGFAAHIMSGQLGRRNHAGAPWIEALDTLLVDLAKRVFGAAFVEYRATSGAIANGLALSGVIRHGDLVMALPARFGGHHSYREAGYAKVLGYRLADIPCDPESERIDLDLMERTVRRERPKLIMLGTAEMRFPYPLKDLRAIADTVDARIFYDGAHILGLVAGGEFQDPLREGADILTGSGQKTLGGPISGLIMTRDLDLGTDIAHATSAVVSNYHNNRVAALVVSLAEMATFGRAYASQVVHNARALARALDERGMSVYRGATHHTDSHIVLIDATALPTGEASFQRLEEAMILTTRVPLPATYPARLGLRLGTAALTRLGAREEHMAEVASLIARVTLHREPPAAVARQVSEFARTFQRVHFCFDAADYRNDLQLAADPKRTNTTEATRGHQHQE